MKRFYESLIQLGREHLEFFGDLAKPCALCEKGLNREEREVRGKAAKRLLIY
jgi:hypothetical protein